ncbi:MAG: TfoX/Sxy family protein [Flavobacteriales bacterium]
MALDTFFQQRILDALLAAGVHPEQKRMFGGVAFMVKGHMCVGITNKGAFMVRIDPAKHAEYEALPGARPMDFTGKRMGGFLFVDADAVTTAKDLEQWVMRSLDHVHRLPPKAARKRSAAKKAGSKRS